MHKQPQVYKIQQYTLYPDQILGKGAFGIVYKGFDEKEKQWLAVKTFPLSRLRKESEEYLFGNEINTLCGLKIKNIVQLKDAIEDALNLYLFFEYCDGGDLEKLIKVKRHLSEREACSIVRQITEAFVTLNKIQNDSPGTKTIIMHRDIKPANILFHKGVVKVSDFGFAKAINYHEKDAKKKYEHCGTPYYTSPQILGNKEYSLKCDIWSTGILFYEILFGVMPWDGNSSASLYDNIRKKEFILPRPVSPETEDLLVRMLAYNEETRISWEDMYTHLALKEVGTELDYSQLEKQRLYKPPMVDTRPKYPFYEPKEVKRDERENRQYNVEQIKRPIFGQVYKEANKEERENYYYKRQEILQGKSPIYGQPEYRHEGYPIKLDKTYLGVRPVPGYLDKK